MFGSRQRHGLPRDLDAPLTHGREHICLGFFDRNRGDRLDAGFEEAEREIPRN